MINFEASIRDNMHGIDTSYRGYWFRSMLEARWAVFFETMGLEWAYEVQGFRLGDGINYLPDFYVGNINVENKLGGNNSHVWVEVKGVMKAKDEEKCRRLAIQSEIPVLMVQGDPLHDELTVYNQEGNALEGHLTTLEASGACSVVREKPKEDQFLLQAGTKARSKRF